MKKIRSHVPELLPSILLAILLLYIFLVGITCLSGGIKTLGKGVMDVYFSDGMNPILGLLVGVLGTTLVQSSSVTTALIVGLVGAGQVSVGAAVPMVMGANIGTTVTNTIASLAHANRDTEFHRAFSAATCHDFFNAFGEIFSPRGEARLRDGLSPERGPGEVLELARSAVA